MTVDSTARSAPAEGTATAPPAVLAEELAFHYGDPGRPALRGVSFAVAPGEVHLFLGPNGSGKSTLFKILATILPPRSGHAAILGIDLASGYAEVRRRIGVVFQSPALDRKLSVRQNLTYGGHLYGLRGPALRARVDAMLDHVGLSDRAADKIETLSGGLKRRVELAKGLLADPAVVLLDEPTTGLDPGARRDLWQLLRSLEGRTILATTHLLEEAERADRITILHEGAVVAAGTPNELKAALGGEVLQIDCNEGVEPASLCNAVEQRFGVRAQIVDRSLRLQSAGAHRLVGDLVDEFGRDVLRVSFSQPSLEDVYIQKTGHRFWAEKS